MPAGSPRKLLGVNQQRFENHSRFLSFLNSDAKMVFAPQARHCVLVYLPQCARIQCYDHDAAIASAVRRASAIMLIMGFVPGAVGKALPSPIQTPGVS